jgi:hypothetical protein
MQMINNANLEAEDLFTVESFRRWIKKHFQHLYLKSDIPLEHLLIYLNYIRSLIFNLDDVDKSFWVKLIGNLEKDINSLKRVEE